MIVVTAVRAETHFGELIDQAQREPVEMTRRGRPVADMVCGHDLKALQDINARRAETANGYANDRRAAATSPQAAVLSDADIDRLVHELR